jgi:hypothetical protein
MNSTIIECTFSFFIVKIQAICKYIRGNDQTGIIDHLYLELSWMKIYLIRPITKEEISKDYIENENYRGLLKQSQYGLYPNFSFDALGKKYNP